MDDDARGLNSEAPSRAADTDADWGGSWDASPAAAVRARAPDPDDPWAERVSSSLFSYDAPSLHAAPAPAPSKPAAKPAAAPAPASSPFASSLSTPAAADLSERSGGSNGTGCVARTKYANATALSAADFYEAAPKAEEPGSRQMERDEWMAAFANSTAISSSDLSSNGSTHKRLTGFASSWLGRTELGK